MEVVKQVIGVCTINIKNMKKCQGKCQGKKYNIYNYRGEVDINNQQLGKKGEDVATTFLQSIGYKIIDRNFRCKQGEIDIIAKDKEEYVFVEVKTRTSTKYGRPAEAVNYLKKQHIYKVAKYFLYKYKLQNYSIRFDVIEVFYCKNRFYINHIKNIE